MKNLIKKEFLILDGAMGTEIQKIEFDSSAWDGVVGCNEILNKTAPEVIKTIYKNYYEAGANIVKTNTFGAIPWVLEDYDRLEQTHELAYLGAKVAKEVRDELNIENTFVAGSLGPGTKLPSLGHINYAQMYSGYKISAKALIEGGIDLFLLETCQDPLQVKACLNACFDVMSELNIKLPVMVSATIELSGTMLIGTDANTIATILEPFDIFSLGFNCGTGPVEVKRHLETLSKIWNRPISVHSNAGLPENRGGETYYPMKSEEFASLQREFCKIDGVALLGGCCGTTPEHIKALKREIENLTPKAPTGEFEPSIASLFTSIPLKQNPAPTLVGERSNATGSKAFRELLINEDFEGTLTVGQTQVRGGAHCIDVSVGFAGRDERGDMQKIISLYNQKISLPLMPDSTQTKALEIALQNIGGKPIINSVNFEDGEEKFDEVCRLAKKYGASLICLTIDEEGMAKTKERKVEVAKRMYKRATELNGLKGSDLVFDLLTFTIGSGDEEYFTAGIETIEAIREVSQLFPDTGSILGLSNISFGLSKECRIYLNSIFLHHCVEAGLSMAIVNVAHLIPYFKISDEDREICENLIFNRRSSENDPLFALIEHFSNVKHVEQSDDEFNSLSTKEKISKLLIDGDKERMLKLLPTAKDEIKPEIIVNEILIDAMKVIGELFGSGQMQLPFVLQSAEVMKASVDFLNPFLPKKEKSTETIIVLGTVKGDVHDVGKNLVDIILTNNGFKVINIGIKADIEEFIKACREHNASAIGMSGLLVKSTNVMKENLIELRNQKIDVPVLLGGAALTKKFIDEYCRSNYDGAIFYCKDAFDGIVAMSRIENGNLDTNLSQKEEIIEEKIEKEKIEIPPIDKIKMPTKLEIPTPPFIGRRVFVSKEATDRSDKRFYQYIQNLAFDWINHKMLFKQRWGYKSKGIDKEVYEKQINEEVKPAFERLKKEFIQNSLFEPTIIYGYFECKSLDNSLSVFDEEKEFNFDFPRQQKPPFRALNDYFRNGDKDIIGLSIVSAGEKISKYEKELFDKGNFKEYYLVHGLGVELAEALAEIIHKQFRIDLDILKNEKADLSDVKMGSYVGSRYSFGYPACPDLELNRPLFEILKPESFGIELSETAQIHPEQSTSAIIAYHSEASYFNV